MVGIMKTTRLVWMGLALLAGDVNAADKPSQLEKLVELEMSLGARRISGFGEGHPEMLRLKAEIGAIEEEEPGIRDKRYFALLKENRRQLAEKQATAIEEGIGEKHPQRVELSRQLAAIDRQLKVAER
jgi:hypothetical protein